MKIAILCPGQGTQNINMIDIIKQNDISKNILNMACDILGADLYNLNENTDIFNNSFAQPFISATQIATFMAIEKYIPPVSVFAGYSLGELSIYGCNGALSPKDTIEMAQKRALLMDNANTKSSALLSCQNIPQKIVENICNNAKTFISIINVDNHFIIGGEINNLEKFQNLSEKEGAVIKKINVKLASHTPLLKNATESFYKELKSSSFKNPNIPSISSISNDFIFSKEDAIETLSKQISQTILWESTLETLLEYGCDTILELGPGKALSKMIQKLDPNIKLRSVSDFKTIDGIINWINN